MTIADMTLSAPEADVPPRIAVRRENSRSFEGLGLFALM